MSAAPAYKMINIRFSEAVRDEKNQKIIDTGAIGDCMLARGIPNDRTVLSYEQIEGLLDAREERETERPLLLAALNTDDFAEISRKAVYKNNINTLILWCGQEAMPEQQTLPVLNFNDIAATQHPLTWDDLCTMAKYAVPVFK